MSKIKKSTPNFSQRGQESFKAIMGITKYESNKGNNKVKLFQTRNSHFKSNTLLS